MSLHSHRVLTAPTINANLVACELIELYSFEYQKPKKIANVYRCLAKFIGLRRETQFGESTVKRTSVSELASYFFFFDYERLC